MRFSALAFLVSSMVFTSLLSAQTRGTFTDLGVQITSLTLQGTTFANDPASGRDLVCTVIRGQPAKLLVFQRPTLGILLSMM